MKNLKQFLINLAIGFVAINVFGALFLTGSAYPLVKPVLTTVVVPFSRP